MNKESNTSQDYDRKHGDDHNVSDKASLRGGFIDNKSKPADKKDWEGHVQKSDKSKN